MKRLAILTAGGDTPALNATIRGAVARANQRRVEVIGLLEGFNSLFDPRVPHIRLNPLYSEIPELDPTQGGSILGSSRRYLSEKDNPALPGVMDRLQQLKVGGLICVGGDGTMNGMQPLCELIPTVLAPKTIDNDLGLNYRNEPDRWIRVTDSKALDGFRYESKSEVEHGPDPFRLDQIVNYVTPGYATAVYVSAAAIQRVRTTAESHRRIAIVEVMGRHSGFIALGTSYGQPDIVLLPECPVILNQLVARIQEIYDRQHNLVIVCGEGIVDENRQPLGASRRTTDPAGNLQLSGAAENLRIMLIEAIGDRYFRQFGIFDDAHSAIFTRKVGHTQRGGRPLAFDRFHAAQVGGHAVNLLLEGHSNAVAVIDWNASQGFHVSDIPGNSLRDRWGTIHARRVHPSFYNAQRMQPSGLGIDYLLPIFTNAIGADDMEFVRQALFDSGNLYRTYHSPHTDLQKRIEYLRSE